MGGTGFYNRQARGRGLIIKDEGITLSSDVGTLDFTGAGVTGSVLGDTVTEEIPGGGGSGTLVNNEIIAGSGTAFTLAGVPVLGSEQIYADRARLYPTTDYTIAGAAITTVLSYAAGDLLATYFT